MLELPYRLTLDEKDSSPAYGRFEIDPFEEGLAVAVGNSLRRILLSSIEGSAVTLVKFNHVPHEFTALSMIHEDIQDILDNLRDLRVRVDVPGDQVMKLRAEHKGQLAAGHLRVPPGVSIVNPAHAICTLLEDTTFEADITVRRGRRYLPADEHDADEGEPGLIRVNANFSPVYRVKYHAQPMHLRRGETYERLVLEIWTNGAVTPEEALWEASGILRKHLEPFVRGRATEHRYKLEEQVERDRKEKESREAKLKRILALSVDELDLSVRSRNCLEKERIRTVGQLVRRDESEMLKVAHFGKTSIREVKKRLAEIDLHLGMRPASS